MSERSPKTKRRTHSKSESENRRSSFTNTSSPWFRRNSFLSSSMIHSENISVYESASYYSESSGYSIISLKESQGFLFNQDLFASPFQQQRTLANERKIRSQSYNQKSRSNSINSKSRSASFSDVKLHIQRRHTSCDTTKPHLTSFLNNSAIEDDDDENIRNAFDQFENTTIDIELSQEDVIDDETDVDDSNYKVHVTEIMVNDNDDLFPN